MDIGLVGCTDDKADQAAKPADLYMESTLFQRRREYAEQNHDTWYILSAKHQLLNPYGPVIEPYDETLKGAPVAKKREWSRMIQTQLQNEGLLTEGNRLVFHAGRDYYEELIPLIEDSPVEIETPVDGLRIGPTIAWYNEQL
jgi:hypothetical protein